MSFQEEKLTAIADAIREKDGTTALILADDFPARIRAIPAGGGSDFAVPLVVSTDAGALIAAVNGGITVSGTAGEDGTATLILTAQGEWTVTAKWNGEEKSASVTVEDGYSVNLVVSWRPRLPEGYTEVEYIQSDRACSINCSYMPSLVNDRIVLDIEAENYSGTKEHIFASYNVSGAACCDLSRTAGGQLTTKLGTQNYNYTVDISNKRIIIDCDFTKNIISFGDVSHSISKNAQSATSVFCLFRGNSTAAKSIQAKLYSAQIYSSGTLIRDFVPCINPSGVIGLYDLTKSYRDSFFRNSGTGTLTAGPIKV